MPTTESVTSSAGGVRVRRRTPASPTRSEKTIAASDARDARVPQRSPGVRGPLDVYYYDHLAETLGSRPEAALFGRPRGDVLAYEALNLADGTRSISEIRDVLSGRYEPVPLSAIAEYFELLARAGAVQLR